MINRLAFLKKGKKKLGKFAQRINKKRKKTRQTRDPNAECVDDKNIYWGDSPDEYQIDYGWSVRDCHKLLFDRCIEDMDVFDDITKNLSPDTMSIIQDGLYKEPLLPSHESLKKLMPDEVFNFTTFDQERFSC